MKIVVGGASGLIGKRLVQALRARGDEVCELVRVRRGEAHKAGPRGANSDDQQPWDGVTQGAWVARIDGADAVINLAGENIGKGRWTEARKKQLLDSRVDSTRAIVTAIRAATQRPRLLINASAVGYYGPRGDEPLDETAAPGQDFLADLTVAWEAEAQTAEPLGVRLALVRTGIVLAPPGAGSALDAFSLPFKLFVGGPIGDGRQWLPWIHVDDEIAALLWTIDHEPLAGPLNLASPGIQTMGDFSRSLGAALHRPSWLQVPSAALHLALGEFADAITTGQRAVPKKLLESGFQFRFPNLDPALRDLLARGDHSSPEHAQPAAESRP